MFKMLRLFFGLMMLTKFAVEDAPGGGGSETGGADIDNNEVPPQTKPATTEEADANKDSVDPKEIEELKQKLKDQEEFIQKQKNHEAVTEAVNDIKTRHSDFDDKKVYEYLKKLNETDPQKAAALNNPLGWENVWYQIRPTTPSNDRFTSGRNTEPVDRDDEVFSLVKSGGATLADEADVVAKYL